MYAPFVQNGAPEGMSGSTEDELNMLKANWEDDFLEERSAFAHDNTVFTVFDNYARQFLWKCCDFRAKARPNVNANIKYSFAISFSGLGFDFPWVYK